MEQCQGVTSAGTRCKRRVPKGIGFCFQHQKQSAVAKKPSAKRVSPIKKVATKKPSVGKVTAPIKKAPIKTSTTKKPSAGKATATSKKSPTRKATAPPKKSPTKKASVGKITAPSKKSPTKKVSTQISPVTKRSPQKKPEGKIVAPTRSKPALVEKSPQTYLKTLPMNIIQAMLRDIELDQFPIFCAKNSAIMATCRRRDTLRYYLEKLGWTHRLMYLHLSGVIGSRAFVDDPEVTLDEKAVICAGAVEGNQLELVSDMLPPIMELEKKRVEISGTLISNFAFHLASVAIEKDFGVMFVYLQQFTAVYVHKFYKRLLRERKTNCLEEVIKADPNSFKNPVRGHGLAPKLQGFYRSAIRSDDVEMVRFLIKNGVETSETSTELVITLRQHGNMQMFRAMVPIIAKKLRGAESEVEFANLMVLYAAYYDDNELFGTAKTILIKNKKYRGDRQPFLEIALYFAARNGNQTMYSDIIEYLRLVMGLKLSKSDREAINPLIFDVIYSKLGPAWKLRADLLLERVVTLFTDVPLEIYRYQHIANPHTNVDYVNRALEQAKYNDIYTYIAILPPPRQLKVIKLITVYAANHNNILLLQQVEALYPGRISYNSVLSHGVEHVEMVRYALDKGGQLNFAPSSSLSFYSLMLLLERGYTPPKIDTKAGKALQMGLRLYRNAGVKLYLYNNVQEQKEAAKQAEIAAARAAKEAAIAAKKAALEAKKAAAAAKKASKPPSSLKKTAKTYGKTSIKENGETCIEENSEACITGEEETYEEIGK